MPSDFQYTANAVALGGIITKPKRGFIPSQASVVLSPTGGYGSATVTNYNYRNFILFDEARTDVLGTTNGAGVFQARTRMSITNLDIGEVLHADYIEATVISIRNLADPEETESQFTFDVRYEGLLVNGEDVAPELSLPFFNERPTYAAIRQAALRQTLLAANNDAESTLELAAVPKLTPVGDPADREYQASLVRSLNANGSGRIASNVREIHGLGRLRLGEVLVKNGRRRLSMLRLDLGALSAPVEPVALPQGAHHDAPPPGSEGSVGVLCQDGNGTEVTPPNG